MAQAPTAQPTIPTGAGTINRRYLQVQDLRRLRNLVFSSKRVVEGQYAGRHASPQRGHSVEFNDYRDYTPGDEIGDIDWKVYGRSDKLFIKLFEHQSDMTVNLMVDASASMAYAGLEDAARKASKRRATRAATTSKYDHACYMAASIAFLTTKQQDKVAFAVAKNGLKQYQRPLGSYTHLMNILDAMERVRPHGKANLAATLHAYAKRTGRKGLLVLFSDLLEDQEAVMRALSVFTHRGNEVIVFHVLHADELRLPDLSEAIFIDSESDGRVRLNVDDIRTAYETRLRRMLDSWSAAFRARGIDYNLVSTATPYNKALEHYLFSRASMM